MSEAPKAKREFWIRPESSWAEDDAIWFCETKGAGIIHVIKYSAYEELRTAILDMVQALERFGSQCSYTGYGIDFDKCDCAAHVKKKTLTTHSQLLKRLREK